MQQMRNTVESGMQAFMEMTKERSKSPHARGVHPPPATPAAEPLPVTPLPPLPRLHRRSRSRSQHFPSQMDKRPISIPRSPRRHRRDSRSRQHRRRSRSRDDSMSPGRPRSVTLRSNSPRHREDLHQREELRRRDEYTSPSTTQQPPSWHDHHYEPPSISDKSDYQDYSSYPDYGSTKKWKSWQYWKDQSKSQYYTHPSGWIDYSKPHYKHQSYDEQPSKYPSKPLTAYSLDKHSHSQGNDPNRSGSAQSRASTLPPGHMAINLQEGSREEWARQVKHALTHSGRMRAASELDAKELPQPSTSIVQEHFDDAMDELTNVDVRIPPDIGRKAIHLLSSTGLLTDFDFSACYVRELPQTGMLALVMPLPEMSRFQMPPPFGGQTLVTHALGHGTTLSTAQLILMEGKIRPANWSYHKNPHKCDMPTFGAFYIGRQIANADKNFPSWAEQELLDSMEKKGKGQQAITIGAIYRGSMEHLALRGGGNEKCQLNVAKKGIVTTPEKYTIAHSNHVGLKFIANKWSDLKDDDPLARRPIELKDTDSEDNVNYRPNEERHAAKRKR